MKRYAFPIAFAAITAIEIIVLIVFAIRVPEAEQDVVKVNETVRSVSSDWGNIDAHKPVEGIKYVVIDLNGNVLFRTDRGLSESQNSAINHRDTMLDVYVGDDVVGKLIIYNDQIERAEARKNTAITVISVLMAVQCALGICYLLWLEHSIVKPFKKLKGFAERIAGGNLDIPLEMDRQNIFGAFTESFDIMRCELKKARCAEAQANASKKELVAKLSHDIKTPVASIKAAAEVGAEISSDMRTRDNFMQIVRKSDQINTLVTNLFTATLEELQQLSVTPVEIVSTELKDILDYSDYLNRAEIPDIDECLLIADRLRLQQVFDNVFANSYKYANTPITVETDKTDSMLYVYVEDYGGGVPEDEIPLLTEKFKRGSNAVDKDGAGLGLFISQYFMNEMGGAFSVENGKTGLRVGIGIRLAGKG